MGTNSECEGPDLIWRQIERSWNVPLPILFGRKCFQNERLLRMLEFLLKFVALDL